MIARLARTCVALGLAALAGGCEGWSWGQPERPPIEPVRAPFGPDTYQQGQPTRLVTSEETMTVGRVVERGTGRFVGEEAEGGRSRASVATDAAGEVTLNVVDAELREVVRLVLEDALGVNYVIDPAVGGRITVQTTHPLPPEDLVPTLDAILRMNGAALVQTGDLFQVVPIERALSSGPIPGVRPLPAASAPGFSVVVVPLRFASAPEITQVLEPFTDAGGTITVDAPRNLLLLAGTGEQIATLQELVAIFDVDWLQGMSFGLFPLETAAATDIAVELDAVFGNTAEGPLAGIVRVVPIERLNAILVVSAQPAYLDRAETWIERLDRAGEGEELQIYVYNVQNARATNLAEVLGEIFAARTTTVGESSLLTPGLEPVELGSTGGFELGQQTDEDTDLSDETDQSRARRRTPRRQRPLAAASAFAQPASTEEESDIRIIADDTTNALVIQARPREYRKIEQALEKLDVLPLQVLIEATIAEVTLNNELGYGVEWLFRSGDFRFSQGAQLRPEAFFPGFSALFTSGQDVRVVLNALERVTDVDVISSPQLLVLDNQTARLQVGDQVPITVQQAQSVTDSGAPIINSVELRDTGVILTVTPRVNVNGLVILEIQQEVSNVVRSESQTTTVESNTPTINQRQISSTVAVQSGETVALGGLITDNRDRGSTGLPFLSRIPVLGALFSTKSNIARRTELLVLLTPSVIGSQAEARAVTAELRRRMRGLDLAPPAEISPPPAQVPLPPAQIPLPPPPKTP